MKILSLGTYLFAPAWRDLGHTVKVVADFDLPRHPDTLRYNFFDAPDECEPFVKSLVESFRPDIIFQGDHSRPLIHCGLETIEIPKAWISIDTHLHGAWHRHYGTLFDRVFCAQQHWVSRMSEFRRNAEWIPLFCQNPTDFLPWRERSHEVSFVGKVDPSVNPARSALFDALLKRGVPLHLATGDYAPVYQSSKIVVNQSVAGDLNLRFFEATGCGALLITDRLSHSMNDILTEGADFITYTHDDPDDLIDKITFARNHPAESEAMARRAHEKIRNGYLERHIAGRAAERLAQLLSQQSSSGAFDQGAVLAHSAWAHDHCARLRLPKPLSEFFAERAEGLAEYGRASEEGRPWALLVQAGCAVDKGNYLRARSILMQLPALPNDPDFRVRFYTVKTEAEALGGFREEALATIVSAREEFPGKEGWEELGKRLGL
jgi:hypothetical protein